MSQILSHAEFLINGRRSSLPQIIEKVSGMETMSSYGWQWLLEGQYSQVKLGPDNAIRISLDVPAPPPQAVALSANRDLPGNLRFARSARQTVLMADTQLDGVAHLPHTFDTIKRGLQLAMGTPPHEASLESLATDEVQTAIDDCDWPKGDVVQLENAWEFRPRLHGDAVPVQVAIDGDEVRLSRTVVADLGSATDSAAIAEQALRFNHQLRHARLTMTAEALVAETRLHHGQLTPHWLELASCAVAVASRYVAEVLNVLASDSEIAEHYAAMFVVVDD